MQSILRWSIEHSEPLDSNAPRGAPKPIDPEIIDMILGKPEGVQMKEDMEVAIDPLKSEDDRVAALDHLEMLVEQIDNANNIEKLDMWRPLQALVTAEDVPASVKVQALWVIGTAVQNNPAAQDAYMLSNPLPTLVGFLTPSSSNSHSTRSKALYVISGLLKHNAPAVEALSDPNIDGWTKLKASLQDPEISVRRRTVFMLNSLLLPSARTTVNASLSSANIHSDNTRPDVVHANSHVAHAHNPLRGATSEPTLRAFETHDLLNAIIASLTNPVPYGPDGDQEGPDVEYEEKSIQLLHTYALTCNGDFSPQQKESLKSWFTKEFKGSSLAQQAEKWGMTTSEVSALQKCVE